MNRTMVVSDQQLEALAGKLNEVGGSFDEIDTIALLTIFELAREALDARIEEKVDVAGFAQQPLSVGIQVGVPSMLPGPGDGLLTSMKGKKPKKSEPYLQVRLQDCLVSGY